MLRFRLCALALASVLAVPLLSAATPEFKVLIDADDSSATGCASSGLSGVEHVVSTQLLTATGSASVQGLARQQCSGSTLGPALAELGGWPVGVDPSKRLLIETFIPLSAFGGSLPPRMRLAFVGASGTISSSVITSPDGQPLVYPPPVGRRHAVSGIGAARTITLDGDGSDWAGIAPLTTGSAAGGNASFRIAAVYAFPGTTNLYFRIDAVVDDSLPIAVDDAFTLRRGGTVFTPAPGVLGNDRDPEGRPLTAVPDAAPASGTFRLSPDGSFVYQHDGSATTSDQFRYRASNGAAQSEPATVSLTVLPNNAPVAVADSYSIPHRGTLNIVAPGVLANDNDPDGDPLSATLVTGAANGTLALSANGAFTYAHNGTNTLSDSFSYSVSDGFAGSSPVTVSITIGPNQAPVANNDTFTVAEGSTLNVAAPGLFTNDTDADTPQSFWTATVVTAPVNGTLTPGTGGAFTYVHNGSETTSDSFTYRISDGLLNSNTATVTLTITPVNDAPVANADAYTTAEDTVLNGTTVLVNDTDAEGTALTASVVTNPANGTLTLNASGTFTYTPNANFNGTDSFTYRASDGGAFSNNATVTITVTPVNDPPAFTGGGNVTVNEDSGAFSQAWATAITPGGGADEAGQTVSFAVTNNNNALFSTQPAIAANGTLTFTPAANANGSANLTVIASDSAGGTAAPVNFTITVTPVNDPPSFALGANQTVNEDAAAQTIASFATAITPGGGADEAAQTVAFNVTNDNNALFSAQPAIAANGTLTYTPAANATGTATVTVTATDSGGATSAPQTFTITINAVNDAPVNTLPAAPTTSEDTPLAISGLSVADVDATTLKVTLTATNGTLTLGVTTGLTVNNNGTATVDATGSIANLNAALASLTFTPNTNYSGPAQITVLTEDLGQTGTGGALSDSDNLAITVTSANDTPVVNPATFSLAENSANATVVGTVTFTDADAGDTHTFAITAGNTGGAFAINAATGQITVANSAALNFEATPSFSLTVTVTDNSGAGNAAGSSTITVNLTDVNEAPTFTSSAAPSVPENTTAAVTVTTSDPEGNTITYSITGGADAALFSINASTGALTFNAAPNFEAPADAGANNVYDVVVTASDGTNNPTQAIAVTVTNVNEAPVNTVPGAQSVNEDTPLALGGISVSDVDGNLATTQLSVSSGTLNVSLAGGATISAGTNGSSTLTLSGTQAQINAALATLSYQGNLNFSGADTLTVLSTDSGPLTDSDTISITVNAVNDTPVNTVPGAQSVNEDTPLAIGGVSVNDPDGNLATTQLSVTNGTVTVSLAGGATISAGANGSSTLTLSGTQAQINAALGTLSYQGNLNFSGADTLTVLSTDAGALTDSDTVAITINAVNDPPVNTVPGAQSVNEDTPLAIGGISVNDVDGNLATTQLSVTNGTITVSLAGGATISAGANGSSTLTLSGTQAQINAALASLSYQGNLNFNGADTLTVLSTDSGALSDSDTVSITVNPLDDAPVNTVPGAQSVNEDTALALGGISVSDVDGNLATTQLSVTNGTVTVNLAGGATISAGANGTSTLTLSGTQAQINAALATLSYQGNLNFNGADTLTVLSTDSGALSDSDTVAITINAVNDAPVNTVPGAQSVNEDSALAIGGISVNDVDGNLATTQLSATNGTLTVSLAGGATITAGANGSSTLTLSGTQAQINGALATVSYQGNLNFNGADTLTVLSTDSGTLTDSDTVAITVNGVDDAPVNTVPGAQNVNEDTPLAIGGISVNDVDGNLATTQLSVSNGTLTVSLAGGATISAGVNGTSTLTLSGTQTQINAALATLSYQGNLNFNGADTLTVLSTDASALTDSDTVAITINAVNDPPVNTVPGAQSVNEDTALAIGGISVNDIEGNLATTQLTVTNGTVTVSLAGGATISAGANGSSTLTLSGTQAQINAALATVSYQGNLNFNGAETLTVLSTDSATATDSDTVAITVNAIDDAPVNTVPGAQNVNEDTALALGGVSVNDVDGNLSTTQLSVNNGTVTVSLAGGATIGAGANGSSTLTLSGTQTQINAALATLSYQGNLNFNGADTLTVLSTDGSALTDSDTVAITINAVNDPPLNTVPGAQSAVENTPLAIGGVSVDDVDGNLSTTQLSVANGTVTVSLAGGATISAGANGSATLTLSGTQAQINAALATLSYQGNLNFSGTDTLTVLSTDSAAATDSDTVTIVVEGPPRVTSTTPVDLATGVARNTNISIVFNESVTVTAASFEIKCPSTASAHPFTLSGSGASYTLDPTGDLPAGVTCQVRVLAANVTDADAVDPPDNMAADYTFTFKIPPAATNDTYPHNVIGNVSVNSANVTPTAFSVVDNDLYDAGDVPTITAFDATSLNGGTVTMTTSGAGLGRFTYNPPRGYEGADSFTYTITNGAGSATGTVNLTVAGMVWFINNNAGACAASCDGRMSNPYTTIDAFKAANDGAGNNPAAGDNIFVYESATSYSLNTTGLKLLTGQKLIGQDSTSSLATITGLTPGSSSAPFPAMNTGAPATTINTATAAINPIILGTGNTAGTNVTLNGFTLGTSTGAASINASSFGTLTTADVTINNTNDALSLVTGTCACTFSSVTSTGGARALNLQTVAGTLTINGGALSGATVEGITVNGGTVSITGAATLSQTTNAVPLLTVTNHSAGTIAFSNTLNATTGTGLRFDNADGTYNFTGTTTLNGGDAGIDILNGSAGMFSFGTGTAITSPTGIAFNVNGSTPNVTYSGNITQANATDAVNITNQASGTINFQTGTITTTGATSTGLTLNNADGTVNFNGTANLAGARGITISNGSAGTINFSSATSITNPNGVPLTVDGSVAAVTALITYSGTISTTGATYTVDIDNLDGTGSFLVNGLAATNITGNANGNLGIRVQNSSGNIVMDRVSLTLRNTGLTLTNNAGGSMLFSRLAITTTNAGNVPIVGSGGGSLTLTNGTGSTTISSADKAIDLNGMVLGASTITSVTSGGGVNGILLTNCTGGTLTISGGTLTGATGAAFAVSGGSVSVTYSGNITVGNPAGAGTKAVVSVTGGHNGTLTFNTGTLSSIQGLGLQFDNSDGTYSFNGTTTLNGADSGIDILNGSSGTFSFGTGVAITSPSGTAFNVNSSAPTVTQAGTITQNNGGQRAINITGLTGGVVTFSGSVGSTGGTGISIEGTGGAVHLTGVMTLSGAGSIFRACSGTCAAPSGTGLTITAPNTSNNIGIATDATGPAVTINRAQIGSAGVNFQRIDSTGGVNAIVISNTGTAGFFSVNGTGAADSGGTLANQTGDAISLTSTDDITLTDLQITNAGDNAIDATTVDRLTIDSVDIATATNSGIRGTTVTDFKYRNGSTITGSGNAANTAGIQITDMLGANNILTNSSVTGSDEQNVQITNTSSTSTISVTNMTLSTTTSSDALQVNANGTSVITLNVSGGNLMNGVGGDGLQVSANNDGDITVSVNGTGANFNGNLGSAVNIAAANTASITATVSNFNGVSTGTSSANGLNVINIQNFDTSVIRATVNNNVISGLGNNASGIRVIQEGNGTITALLQSNTISGMSANGIVAQARAGTGLLNLTIGPANTVTLTSGTALDGINVESGSSAGGDTNTVCLNMLNNSSSSAGAGPQSGYRLRQRTGTTFNLQNFAGNGANAADITAWVNTTKSNTGTTDIVIGSAFSSAPANCGTP